MKIFAKLFVLLAVTGLASYGAMVIDFSTNTEGGTFTVGAMNGSGVYNSSATNVPINFVTISGAPSNNGNYAVTGGCGGFGCLNFDTAANTINITGQIAALGVANTTLLTGSFGSFGYLNGATLATNGGAMSTFVASGPDVKDPTLLRSIGAAPGTTFAYAGYSIATNNIVLTTGSSSTIISSDIRNTATPEPASLALIGLGLVGLAIRKFRRA